MEYGDRLRDMVESETAYGMSELVLSGFVRVITNRRVFDPPMPTERALAAAESIRSRPNCVLVAPAPRHWEIFARLCRETNAKGNLVPDAYLAALAIESGSEWVTTDRAASPGRGPLYLWILMLPLWSVCSPEL